MASERQVGIIKRDSAIVTSDLIKVPIRILFNEDAPVGGRILSFDPQGEGGAELLMLTEQQTDMVPEQLLNYPFEIQHWCAKAIELVNQTNGKTDRAVRVTLISPSKSTVAFTSRGVVESMDVLRLLYGDGPYQPPIKVWVNSVKTRSGWKMSQLTTKSPTPPSPPVAK